MDKLKVSQIKDIFKFVGVKGYSTLKKPQLLEKMRNEGIYDNYLNKKKSENQEREKNNKIKDEKIINLDEFMRTVRLKNSYNDDESDTEDSVCEDEFEDFKNNYLIYGDYQEFEDELNTKNTDQEKKEYLLSTDFGDEDISDYEYTFGNSLQFSQNRAHSHYIIGKNDELIVPEMFGDGDLVIPYEITKYNKNATHAFDMELVDYIYLRYDDVFVKKYIRGRIYKKWNWKILYNSHEDIFEIEFPSGKTQEFEKNTHVKDILLTFNKLNSPKIVIIASIEYEQNIILGDSKPLLPLTWELKSSKRDNSPKELSDNSCFIIYEYVGPEDEKEPFKILLNKSYTKEGILIKIV